MSASSSPCRAPRNTAFGYFLGTAGLAGPAPAIIFVSGAFSSGQGGPRRSVADNYFGSGQFKFEKRLEILFHRNAANAEKDRTRQSEVGDARMKQAGIDPARPQHDIAKAARAQFAGQSR